MDEDELFAQWEEFVAYCEDRNEAMRRQMPSPRR
jgi:hypothetical protein